MFIGNGGSVISQDMPEGKRIDKVSGKTIKLTLSGNETEKKKDLEEALDIFNKRQRRFGKV